MTPGHHRDWGLPGVWEHQGLPMSGRIWQPGPIWPPSQELGCWETLGQPQPRTLGSSLGNGMGQGWDGLLVHGWILRPGDGDKGRYCPRLDTWLLPASWLAMWSSCALLSVHDWQKIADTEVVAFPHFRLKPDMDQSLARPVLHYVLNKFSAGCGPGSNFPAIFPAAHWSALNVAFILL